MKPNTPPGAPVDMNPRPRHPLDDAEELLGTAPSPRVRRAVLAAAAQAIAPAGLAPGEIASRPATGPWQRLATRISTRPALPVALAMATGIFAVALSVQVAPEHPVEAGARMAAALAERRESIANAPVPEAGKTAPPAANPAPQVFVDAPPAGDVPHDVPATPTTRARALPGPPPPSSPRVTAPPTGEAVAPTMTAMMQEPAALAGPAAASPAPLPAPLPAPVVQNTLSAPTPVSTAASAAPARMAKAETGTSAAQQDGSAGAGADAQPGPGDQLRHIILLRALHQDVAADRELAEFVRRYPDIAVPPAARRH